MFYIDFLGFTNHPFYLDNISIEQENLVLCIFNLSDLNKVKWILDFSRIYISSREAPGALELREWMLEA
jgi:hypothetical protein